MERGGGFRKTIEVWQSFPDIVYLSATALVILSPTIYSAGTVIVVPEGECDFRIVLTGELTIGGANITSIPFYEWFGTRSSQDKFTYCYPSGYCVVFIL